MTRLPAGRLAEVARLIADGGSYAAIGRQLGLSKGAVAGIVRRYLLADWNARPRLEPKPPRAKRPRKPRPPKLVPAPAPPPPPPAYYLYTPGPGACSWPLNDARPWHFCASPRAPGSVYCAAHHATAHHRYPPQPWRQDVAA